MRSKTLVATVSGCLLLFMVGCNAKTEDLLSNTLKPEQNVAVIEENVLFEMDVEGSDTPYQIHIVKNETITEQITDKAYYKIEGNSNQSVTNYYSDIVDLSYYNVDNTELTKQNGKWTYKEIEGEFFNRDKFKELFKDAKVSKITYENGTKKAYKIDATTPYSSCDEYLPTSDLLLPYECALNVTFHLYYDVETLELISIKAELTADTEMMKDIYEETTLDYGYDVSAFRLAECDINVSFLENNNVDIESEVNALFEKETFEIENQQIEELMEVIEDTEKDGYYLDDGSYSVTKPRNNEHSWERKENGEIVGSYNKDTNTYHNNQTNEDVENYYNSELSDDAVVLFEGSDVEDKTLKDIWGEHFMVDVNYSRETILGVDFERYDTALLDTDYAKYCEDYFNNQTIGVIVSKLSLSKETKMHETEILALVHLAEHYNIGLYEDSNGNVISFKDLFILCNYTEEEYDALVKKDATFIASYELESTLEEIDE